VACRAVRPADLAPIGVEREAMPSTMTAAIGSVANVAPAGTAADAAAAVMIAASVAAVLAQWMRTTAVAGAGVSAAKMSASVLSLLAVALEGAVAVVAEMTDGHLEGTTSVVVAFAQAV